jgi:aspartyl-tRNA(Asn)/glutamyl-tRNA(Gln) amidotransferase subunit A
LLDEWRDQMDPRLVGMVERAAGITAARYAQAATAREEFWQELRPCFEEFDFLVTPTLAVAAFDVDQYEVTEIAGVKGSPAIDWTPFSYLFNYTGQPAASVPCGWTKDGLPIGLQIIGRRFDDVGVLKVAAAFEKAAPWANSRPDLG